MRGNYLRCDYYPMCCFKFASIITKELKNKGVVNSNVKDLRTNGFFLNCYLIMRQTLIVQELTRLVRVSRIWNSFIIKVSKTTVIVKQCRESNIETYRKTLATDLVIFWIARPASNVLLWILCTVYRTCKYFFSQKQL